MNRIHSIKKLKLRFKNEPANNNFNGNEWKLIRRIIISGIISIILLLIIYYTLPLTVLTVSSLVEYAAIIALAIFLFFLLIRYFGILFFSYFYMNEYTFKPTNGYRPFVSIIVPVYNEALVLQKSINSLLNLEYKNYEIIIVNDGSTDNTRNVVEKFIGFQKGLYGEVKVSLINKSNGGKASALNLGIKVSKAEFVLCMDGDSILTPLSLKMAIRHFVNPEVGAVAGNVKVLNRKMFFTDLQALEYVEGLNMIRAAQSAIRLVNIVPGPIGVFRRTAIQSVDYYSCDTFAEDADLTLRLITQGWKIYYEPNSVSYTEAPAKLQQLLKQRYRWTRGIIQSIKKNKKLMQNSTIQFGDSFILWTMFYEALLWPPMNIAAHLIFISSAIFFGFTSLIFYWWAVLALLDIAAAIYCIAAEKEELRLVGYAIIYRMIFILIIDICKAMSSIEEFLGINMTWGKLERVG